MQIYMWFGCGLRAALMSRLAFVAMAMAECDGQECVLQLQIARLTCWKDHLNHK